MPLLGRQAGLAGLIGVSSGKTFLHCLRGCRLLRLRSPSCTPLGRLIECLVEFWIASVGLVSGWWELTLTARGSASGWRVWCVQTARRLAHASPRLLVFIALSQSRLLLQSRCSLLLTSSGTLLRRSSDRGPIPGASSVDLQSLLASLRIINARSFPCVSRRWLSSTSATTGTSSLTRALSTTAWSCSLRPEGS